MRHSSTFQYKDLMVGQRWTDGVGIIEIIRIMTPSGKNTVYGDADVKIEYQFIPPIKYPDLHKSTVLFFKNFIKNFNGRLVSVDIEDKDPQIPNSKNRFEKIGD